MMVDVYQRFDIAVAKFQHSSFSKDPEIVLQRWILSRSRLVLHSGWLDDSGYDISVGAARNGVTDRTCEKEMGFCLLKL